MTTNILTGLFVVGVSIDEGEDRIKKIRKFIDKVGVSYSVFSDARPIPRGTP